MNSRIVKRFLLLITCASLAFGSTTFAFADTSADAETTVSEETSAADTETEETEAEASTETTETASDADTASETETTETETTETETAETTEESLTGSETAEVTAAAESTPATYKIVFMSNGGKQSNKKIYVTEGNKLGTLPTVTRTGYKFLGWYTAKTGGKKITASTVPTGSTKYYAHWERRTYTVRFMTNGGKQSNTKISVLYGKKVGTLPAVTRRGYLFLGWYTAKTGGKKITASTVIKSSTRFYAHWEKISLKKAAVTVSSAGKKNFSASWDEVDDAEGYQIRYSMDKNMESGVTKVNLTRTSYRVTSAKNLAEGIYWVQVRSWRKDSMGKKTWSKWSTAKAIQYSYCTNNISVSRLNKILNSAANDEKRMALQYALARIGHPYSQAYRNSGYYYDCSSFAYYSYLSAGVNISGAANPAASLAYSLRSKKVSYSNLKVGDLIFWRNGSSRYLGIGHVAIYAGNGMIVDAGNEYYGCSLRSIYNTGRIIMCADPTV